MKILRIAVLAALAPTAALACPGDCDADGEVAVNELVTGVNIALGSAFVSLCEAFDTDADGSVTVNELVLAVNNALGGCIAATSTPTATLAPEMPTITATPTVTNTAGSETSTPTATATPSSTPTAVVVPTDTPTASTSGLCGDTTTVDTFFASNRGFIQVYTRSGTGDLFRTFSDPAGYRLQTLTLLGTNEFILAPATGSSQILPVEAEDVYEDLENEVNILFNPNPAQPQVGLRGVFQCDKATGERILSIASANDPLHSSVTLSSVQP